MTLERINAPVVGDERTLLTAWLDWHRATLQRKCAGLGDAQLRCRAVPPSTLSLLGLVRHMAEVERGWFRAGVDGEDIGDRWITAQNPDAEFDEVDTADVADVAEAFLALAEEITRARDVVRRVANLDQTFQHPRRGDVSVRWVMLHMIEEYARHNGHADLLRECIDGQIGY